MEKFGKFFKKMDESELGVEIMNYSKVSNRNNHHKPTFHPLGDFSSDTQQPSRRVNSALTLAKTRFKEITNWAKIRFCQSSLFVQRSPVVFSVVLG